MGRAGSGRGFAGGAGARRERCRRQVRRRSGREARLDGIVEERQLALAHDARGGRARPPARRRSLPDGRGNRGRAGRRRGRLGRAVGSEGLALGVEQEGVGPERAGIAALHEAGDRDDAERQAGHRVEDADVDAPLVRRLERQALPLEARLEHLLDLRPRRAGRHGSEAAEVGDRPRAPPRGRARPGEVHWSTTVCSLSTHSAHVASPASESSVAERISTTRSRLSASAAWRRRRPRRSSLLSPAAASRSASAHERRPTIQRLKPETMPASRLRWSQRAGDASSAASPSIAPSGIAAKVRNSITAGRSRPRQRKRSSSDRAVRPKRRDSEGWRRCGTSRRVRRSVKSGAYSSGRGRTIPISSNGTPRAASPSSRRTMERTSAASPGAVTSSTAPSDTAGPAGGSKRPSRRRRSDEGGGSAGASGARGVSAQSTSVTPRGAITVRKALGRRHGGRARRSTRTGTTVASAATSSASAGSSSRSSATSASAPSSQRAAARPSRAAATSVTGSAVRPSSAVANARARRATARRRTRSSTASARSASASTAAGSTNPRRSATSVRARAAATGPARRTLGQAQAGAARLGEEPRGEESVVSAVPRPQAAADEDGLGERAGELEGLPRVDAGHRAAGRGEPPRQLGRRGAGRDEKEERTEAHRSGHVTTRSRRPGTAAARRRGAAR